MVRRGDREVGGWWALLAFLAAMVGMILFIIAEAHHSYRLMQWSSVAGISAFAAMVCAMPPRWD